MQNDTFSYRNLILFLREEVEKDSGNELKNKCVNLGMVYNALKIENKKASPIPFTKSYTLHCKIENKYPSIITIFELNNQITEIEVSISNTPKDDINEVFNIMDCLYGCKTFAPGIYKDANHYEDNTSLGYASRINIGQMFIITLRFGNRNIWNLYFGRASIH